MAVGSGLVVANNYYNQPLLGKIGEFFGKTEAEVSRISVLTQIGYAAGLLLIVPLGDMLRRKRLIMVDFLFIIISLLAAAMAPSLPTLVIASFFVGLTSVVPQLFVPMAAHLASDEQRGKAVGLVMSGLLLGILCSRTISGFVGEYFGWQAVFYMAAGIMVVLWVLIGFKLPEVNPSFKEGYGALLRSIFQLARTKYTLQMASMRGFLSFAAFSGFWTNLVFLLKRPPYHAGSDVAGIFGLVGAAGALAASYSGSISGRVDRNIIILATASLMLLSWIVLGVFPMHYVGLIIGVLLLDVGAQALHITNQTEIFAIDPSARNRINTVYMVSYFLGGATGTFVSGQAWLHWQWNGVVICGGISSLLILILQSTASKHKKKN